MKAVGVFGLGKAGTAAIAWLLAREHVVYAWDDNETSRHEVAARHASPALHIAPFEAWPWDELTSVVLSPGVPLTHPAPHAVVAHAREHHVEVVGEVEMLYRAQPDATYIGVTGTNGKSTTTSLIGHILGANSPLPLGEVVEQSETGEGVPVARGPHPTLSRRERAMAGHFSGDATIQVGGNLGTPALALAPLGKGDIYVLEMSSYQLDLCSEAHFTIGVFLNITPDHLDRHGDIEGYISAKLKLFAHMGAKDVAIIAVDDPHTQEIARTLSAQKHMYVLPVSSGQVLSEGVYVMGGILHETASGFSADISGITTLTGAHNWQNAAAAFAACRVCGIAAEDSIAAMKTYPGLPHRLEQIATLRGVRFINDSKATNADAAQHALKAFYPIYWIVGGKAKEGGIAPLKPYFPRIAHAFLIGAAQEAFARTLDGNVPYTLCGTLAVATEKAAEMAWNEHKKDAVVLLSPACASFDQWKSFEQRGDAFRAYVRKMTDEG